MKKISVTFALVLSLVLLLSVSALAAPETFPSMPTDKKIDVRASYQDSETEPDTVYSLDITWGSMAFTYQENGKPVWDPVEHEYTYPNSSGSWSCPNGGDLISITNHSNTEVQCDLTFNVSDIYTGIINGSVSFPNRSDAASYEFPSADDPSKAQYLNEIAEVTLTGTLPENTHNATVGTVTLSFANPNE